MQIGSGQSALSLAVLKTLGVQLPASPQAAETAQGGGAAPAAVSDQAPAPAKQDAAACGPTQSGCDQDTARDFPRGSFVDLKA